MVQAMSHATAKAAMFMAAGLIYAELGHDRIAGLAGIGRALPMSVLAFALGGIALIGVPPSGAYLAKTLLLQAASDVEQWWWGVVIQAGGVFTSSYVVLVLAHAFAPADKPVTLRVLMPCFGAAAALSLAVCSLLLGLVPWQAYLPIAAESESNPLTLPALLSSLWPIAAGAGLAILMGRGRLRHVGMPSVVAAIVDSTRRAALAFARGLAGIDGTLRYAGRRGSRLFGHGDHVRSCHERGALTADKCGPIKSAYARIDLLACDFRIMCEVEANGNAVGER
jgi:NADH:ubiquinone oxidoreductase subunit 5 (subunit L)/multisubunit Na+/H+ antiporter MnhA subunit